MSMGHGGPTVYYNSLRFRTPNHQKEKFIVGGFLQKNWSHRNELRLIFRDIKKACFLFFIYFFLASVLILLNLIYLFYFYSHFLFIYTANN